MENVVVGIDVGGTSTKYGFVTRSGELLASDAIPTNSENSYQTFFTHLYKKIDGLKEKLGIPVEIKGIGVGAPAGNNVTGTIDEASNLNWEGSIPVTEILESVANKRVVLTNDANAATIGEMLYGAGQNLENFISLTLGTGLGSGIVLNKKLIVGQNGHAGEIGHTTVFHNGRSCTCGRRGCLETYVSAPGLIKTVNELAETTELESELRDLSANQLNAKRITGAAKDGDVLALKAFEFTGRILGLKLADIVTCINPEAIILTGGLSKAGSLIVEPAKKHMEDQLLDIFKDQVDISLSTLTEKNAAILGAGAFIWKELEEKELIKSY
ncbi:ROK family protein [Fodinibius sp. Rm-B-1B1-1]|uniref:ROK family protein n=1 Tax=Fodinibius alkaliphilus TaxID=3140241 RepID=UPI00315A63C9